MRYKVWGYGVWGIVSQRLKRTDERRFNSDLRINAEEHVGLQVRQFVPEQASA